MMLNNVYRNILLFLGSPRRISLTWVPWAVSLLGFGLSVCFYYPGDWSYDVSVQHAQAVSGIYGDWHPPVMAASLRWSNRLFNTIFQTNYSRTGILFTLHTLFFWGGGASVLVAGNGFWKKLNGKAWILSLVPLFAILVLLCSDLIPWTASFSKDVGMLGPYLLATGILLNWPKLKKQRMVVSILLLFFLVYGTSLRHNAIFALFPLVVWLTWLLSEKKSVLKIGILSLLLWTGILGVIHYVNYGILKSTRLYPMQERFYADIFLLNHLTGDYVPPPNSFGNDFSQINQKLFDEYYCEQTYVVSAMSGLNENTPCDFRLLHNILLFPGANPQPDVVEFIEYEGLGKKTDIPIPLLKVYQDDIEKTGKEDYAKLRSAWFQRIKKHPAAYIKLRLKTFYYFCTGSGFQFLGINSWILLILLTLTLIPPLCRPCRLINSISFPRVMLGCSALLYITPYLIFLTAEANRYTYWFLATSVISLIMFCHESPLIRSLIKKTANYWTMLLRSGLSQETRL